MLFTSFKSPSFRYKATCVTCLHNKQPKELQQADLSAEARHKHRLTIAPLGGKTLNIYQKAINDPFHLGVVFVCEEEEEEKSVETKKMEVK